MRQEELQHLCDEHAVDYVCLNARNNRILSVGRLCIDRCSSCGALLVEGSGKGTSHRDAHISAHMHRSCQARSCVSL